MAGFSNHVSRLIEQFARLPGIGHKTAQRLAFHMIDAPLEQAEAFARALLDAKEKVFYCKTCQNLCEGDLCSICSETGRNLSIICVVASPKDLVAIENTREYKGLYHILHGTISPQKNIGPDDIKIKELLSRLSSNEVKEVILALNPDIEGEATAMYLARLLKPFGIIVSRIAFGLPIGGDLEYADEVTLLRAIEGRSTL